MTVADQRYGMGSVTLAEADCLDGQPNPVAGPLDRGSFGQACAVCRVTRDLGRCAGSVLWQGRFRWSLPTMSTVRRMPKLSPSAWRVSDEIDLAQPDRTRFTEAVAPFIAAGRRVSRSGRRSTIRPAVGRVDRAAVRAWAPEAGLAVSERGRISAEVIRQHEAAHQQPTRTARVVRRLTGIDGHGTWHITMAFTAPAADYEWLTGRPCCGDCARRTSTSGVIRPGSCR